MRILTILLILTSIVFAAENTGDFYVADSKKNDFIKEYGEFAQKRLSSLLSLMEELKDKEEIEKVVEINKFFNQLQYATDLRIWKTNDYWASRLEFIGKGAGDCEDYAVAKFLTMAQLGVPQKKIFLTYVKAINFPQSAHLVVTYYKTPGTIPYVLDNYEKRILPATARKDLIPVYSFTASDLYLQKQHGLGKKINRRDLKNQKNLKSIDLEIFKRGEQ